MVRPTEPYQPAAKKKRCDTRLDRTFGPTSRKSVLRRVPRVPATCHTRIQTGRVAHPHQLHKPFGKSSATRIQNVALALRPLFPAQSVFRETLARDWAFRTSSTAGLLRTISRNNRGRAPNPNAPGAQHSLPEIRHARLQLPCRNRANQDWQQSTALFFLRMVGMRGTIEPKKINSANIPAKIPPWNRTGSPDWLSSGSHGLRLWP